MSFVKINYNHSYKLIIQVQHAKLRLRIFGIARVCHLYIPEPLESNRPSPPQAPRIAPQAPSNTKPPTKSLRLE